MTAYHMALTANDWFTSTRWLWWLMIGVAASQSEADTCTCDRRNGSCHTWYPMLPEEDYDWLRRCPRGGSIGWKCLILLAF
ncbi:hypothetical protein Tco_1519103 [Tanacetum coccineum]